MTHKNKKLFNAVESKNMQKLKELINSGPIEKIPDNLSNSINYAAREGYFDVVDELIKFGSEHPNVLVKNKVLDPNSLGSAVAYASESGKLSMIKYLVSLGADINDNTSIIFYWVFKKKYYDIANYLGEINAKMSDVDFDTKNIQELFDNGCFEVLRKLFKSDNVYVNKILEKNNEESEKITEIIKFLNDQISLDNSKSIDQFKDVFAVK